jgi:hypothetical protein
MSRPCLAVLMTGLLALSALTLSACDNPPATGQSRADAATRVACQNRAEEAYNQQNRGEIFSPQSQVNTPYSANYTPGIANRGLSELFAHDRMVSDCVRNTGTETDRNAASGQTPGQTSGQPVRQTPR